MILEPNRPDRIAGLRVPVGVIGGPGAAERAHVPVTLSGLASAFGTCRVGRHFGTSGHAAYRAGMASELVADEIDRLCASYTPTFGNRSQGERDGAS